MRGKKAKKLRKEARKLVDDLKEDKLGDVPLAGCPNCEGYQWYVELDEPAPHHQYVEYLICANILCNARVPVHFNIDDSVDIEKVREEEAEDTELAKTPD